MAGKDGSRAIITLKFLLDDRSKGGRVRLEHAWNSHLSAATRAAQNSFTITSFGEEDDEDNSSTVDELQSQTSLESSSSAPATHVHLAVAPEAVQTYDSQHQQHHVGRSPHPEASSHCPRQQNGSSDLTVPCRLGTEQEGFAALPAPPPSTAHEHSSSSSSSPEGSPSASSGNSPAKSLQQPSVRLEDTTGAVGRAAATGTVVVQDSPWQQAACSTEASLQVAPVDSAAAPLQVPGLPPLTGQQECPAIRPSRVSKALTLLWRVQANCMSYPKPPLRDVAVPPHIQLGNSNSSLVTSSSSKRLGSVAAGATNGTMLGPSGCAAPDRDALDALTGPVTAPAGSCQPGMSASTPTCRSPPPAETPPQPFTGNSSNGNGTCHVHFTGPTQQDACGTASRLPAWQRSFSGYASASAAAIAAVDGSAAAGALVGPTTAAASGAQSCLKGLRHTCNAATCEDGTDEVRYLQLGNTGENVEAFIQRRLKALEADGSGPDSKTSSKCLASAHYMAAIAAQHTQRLLQQQQQHAPAGHQHHQQQQSHRLAAGCVGC